MNIRLCRHFLMRFLLLIIFTLSTYGSDSNDLHPFTDLNGRTLRAEFIKANATSVTIFWNGQTFDLPLETLDPGTRDLVLQLSRPVRSDKASGGVHKWTDVQGRTIEAKFVDSDKSTLTLDWNGKVTSLPLTMFSESSRKLAAELQKAKTQDPVVQTKTQKINLDGELDLSAEYPWQNQAGQTARGTFIELGKSELKILMNRGTQEVAIPVESLAKESTSLAKKLQAQFNIEKKQLIALAKKRKGMKVPIFTDGDLDLEHEFTNSSGQVVIAQFVEADDRIVTLLMQRRSKSPFQLSWTSFAEESIAKLEGLRRKKVELDNKKPRIVQAKGNRLSYYGSGKYKGYNTVFEDHKYAVGVPATGTGLHIFIKQEEIENGVSSGPLGILRMSVGFSSSYTDRTNPDRPRRRSRGIKSFDFSPEPSSERQAIQLAGKFTNEGTFEFNIEMTKKGLQFWSKIKDPKGEKWPTSHMVGMSFKGTVPKVKDMAMNQINPVIGDGAFFADPVDGKKIQLPFGESWVSIMKKLKRGALGNLESVEASGKPYDPVKIVVTPYVKDMKLSFNRSYSYTYPLQGLSLHYHSLEKNTEIPSSRKLKINILPN